MDLPEATTVRELLGFGEKQLVASGVPNARRNAEWMLAHVMDWTALNLYVRGAETTDPDIVHAYHGVIARRCRREPLQLILGRTEFMSLGFDTSPGVFVPRPETERVVETALQFLRARSVLEDISVLDLCCGSGVIGVSLAHALPNLRVCAVDVSDDAVRLTRRNASELGVADRTEAIVAHAPTFLSGTPVERWERFTVIAGNPPYIRADDVQRLPPEVREWDPRAALDGGADGMEFYREVAPLLAARLVDNGVVVFEIGSGQGAGVAQVLADVGFVDVEVLLDYSRHERVVTARRG